MRDVMPAPLTEFSAAELHAMWRGGEIARYGIEGYEFFLGLDEVPTLVDRARSLLPVHRAGRIVVGRAAAWVYLGGPPPAELEIARRSWRAELALVRVRPRFGRYAPSEVRHVAGITLTTPRQTAADLLAAGQRRLALELVAALAVVHPIDVIDAVDLAHGAEQPVEMGRVAHLEREL
jgi:hypothetical protein